MTPTRRSFLGRLGALGAAATLFPAACTADQPADDEASGIYNAAGPSPSMGVGELAQRVRTAVQSDAELVQIDDLDFLDEINFTPIPWIPPRDELFGMASVDSSKALDAGLTLRPVEETAVDTLEWFRREVAAGSREPQFLSAERETEILEAWAALQE